MNLDNYSQVEIEREFDMKLVKKDIEEQIYTFSASVEKYEYLIENTMSIYLEDIKKNDIREVCFVLLSMLGNCRAGVSLGEDSKGRIKPFSKGLKKIKPRDIPFSVFVKTIYKNSSIQEMFRHKSLDFVMDLVVNLDEVFFDVVKRVELVDSGEFRTFTYIRSEILFSESSSLRAHYERFRLPLIEKPHNWTEKSKGGYHLNKSECITNRGEINQPQDVLDILNKLQNQAYKHSSSYIDEYNFLFNKFIKDGDKRKIAEKKVENMMLTCKQSYDAIGDRKIYFEWKFDSRGRMYCTGYDINLQGNKAKKGALRPVLFNGE